jgi:hypothetical protein
MAALTTDEVHDLLDAVVPSTEHVTVLGVFPADYLPIEMHDNKLYAFSPDEPRYSRELDKCKNYCFILNTDAAGQPGMHWLAFFYDGNVRGRALEYFDSYGMDIDLYPNVAKAINDHRLQHVYIKANVSRLQSLTSTVCGQYCIVFLAWRARHVNECLRMFMLNLCRRGKTAEARDHIILNELGTLVSRVVAPRSSHNSRKARHSQTCTCHKAPI